MMPWLPESPLWFAKKGDEAKAEKALVLLRGKDYPVQTELKELMTFAATDTEGDVTLREKIKYLASRGVVLPVTLVSTIFFFQVRNSMAFLHLFAII